MEIPSSLSTDVLICGAGPGGVAAALSVARAGRRCILIDPTDWIGGQLTSQAVPPDENRWIERSSGVQGATASYLAFRDAVRQWYRDHRPLNDDARSNTELNPGGGWVSRLCFEPVVGVAVLNAMLSPFVQRGLITILLDHEPIAADVDHDRVRAVTLANHAGETVTIEARYFLDATELGDLLPLTNAGYRVGAEHANTFGELHGRPDADDPLDQQAISWCFAVEHRPGENYTVDRPARYDFWRD
ncbi:MAG: FAD-dependent oxidoreductase [Tepidisphaeraceae bacterium]